MRILYLSKNIENYKAANYQKEFLNALSKKVNLFIYGPGYSNFDKNKKIEEIIKIYGPFNLIFVGHAWLYDGNANEIDPWPKSDLAGISLKKYLFLNKEYANLNKKLNWIKKNKFTCVFSHYQNCKIWQIKTKTQFEYLPFAFDESKFFNTNKKRKYDLAFSGVLQNSRKKKIHSDIRIRILKRLYFTLFDIPLFKKKKYKHLSIFWNSVPTSILGKILSKIFKTYNFLDLKTYSQLQRNTKVYINCKSPMNLISPRYFENIASGCIVITEKNNELKKLLPKLSYIEFSKGLENFDQILNQSLIKFNSSKKIIKKNSIIIRKEHNWNIRVKKILKVINYKFKKNNENR